MRTIVNKAVVTIACNLQGEVFSGRLEMVSNAFKERVRAELFELSPGAECTDEIVCRVSDMIESLDDLFLESHDMI